MEAFRKLMNHLRELRRLDKEFPTRLKAYTQETVQKSQESQKSFQEMRDALGTGLVAKMEHTEARRKRILEAEAARFQKVLDGIQVDEAALQEKAREKTIEKWAEILEASDVTGADVVAAREEVDRLRAGEPSSGDDSAGASTAQPSSKPR